MAFHDTRPLAKATWVQLTANNITELRLQNLSNDMVWIKATVGEVAPTDFRGAWRIMPYQAISSTMLDLAAGLPGANRVYAWADEGASMTVTHG